MLRVQKSLVHPFGWLILVLLVPALASLGDAEAATIGGRSLGDISGHWAQTEILILVGNGVVGGYPDGSFRPDQTVTRAEMVKMVIEGMRLGSEARQLRGRLLATGFSDVSVNDWFSPYLVVAHERGFIRGYDDGTFGGEQSITRAETAVVLARALGQMGLPSLPNDTGFTDYQQIPTWARSQVMSLRAAGIIRGYQDGEFRPQGLITRGEMAVMICRFLAWRGDLVQLRGEARSITGLGDEFLVSLRTASGQEVGVALHQTVPWISGSGPVALDPASLPPGTAVGLVLAEDGSIRVVLGSFLPQDPDISDPDTFLRIQDGET